MQMAKTETVFKVAVLLNIVLVMQTNLTKRFFKQLERNVIFYEFIHNIYSVQAKQDIYSCFHRQTHANLKFVLTFKV